MSSDLIWCVRAPTDMKSTPVSAYSRSVSSVMPPLDSVSQRPATFATACRVSSVNTETHNGQKQIGSSQHGDSPVDAYLSRLVDEMSEFAYSQSADNDKKSAESQWIIKYTTHYDGYE